MTNRYTNVPKSDNKPENVVIIRGGGDLASGTITDYTDAATVFWYWNVRNPLRSGEWFLFARLFTTGSLLWKEFSAEKLTV